MKITGLKLTLLVIVLNTQSMSAGERITVIHAGTLLAIPGEQPRREQSIIVDSGWIKEVRAGYIAAAEFRQTVNIVDLSSSFIMPGFIDTHVHLHGDPEPTTVLLTGEDNYMTDARYALRATTSAMRALRQGFTTLRDVGGDTLAIRDLRDAINAGHIDGPRILTGISSISIPSGTDDRSVGLREELVPLRTPRGVCSGVDGCRATVRQLFKLGADFIKADNQGTAWGLPTSPFPKFTDEEMFAVVDAAHRLGLKVSVHAMGDTIEQALRGGADSIEHAWEMPASVVNIARENGVYIVPTLSSLKLVDEWASDPNSGAPDSIKGLAGWDTTIKGHVRALEAGVKFAFGSDSGGGPRQAGNLDEFLYMEELGMTPMEAIKSATIHAAELLGLSKETGTVEAGKAADIIAVRKEPLGNMENLLGIHFVMAQGTIYRYD